MGYNEVQKSSDSIGSRDWSGQNLEQSQRGTGTVKLLVELNSWQQVVL